MAITLARDELLTAALPPLIDSLSSASRTHLAAHPAAFARALLPAQLRWLARATGSAGPWVWAVGDCRQDGLATRAVGPWRRDGTLAVTYGVSVFDQQHPAPWAWDAIMLMASADLVRPQTRPRAIALARVCLEEYARILELIADDQAELATRIDLAGLPEPLKDLIDRDSEPEAQQRHLATLVTAHGRIWRLKGHPRRAPQARSQARTTAARAAFPAGVPAALKKVLTAALPTTSTGTTYAVLDVTATTRRSALGRAPRWLVLLRESTPARGDHLRVLEIAEQPASDLHAVLPDAPLPESGFTRVVGGDPCQRLLCVPDLGVLAMRTWCHARHVIDLKRLDDGDARRVAQLWGQVLAGFHAGTSDSHRLAPEACAAVAAAARREAGNHATVAADLAQRLRRAHASFGQRAPAR